MDEHQAENVRAQIADLYAQLEAHKAATAEALKARASTPPGQSALAQNAISRSFGTAKTLLETVLPALNALDILYNSSGGLASTITQADLDALPSYSGLTKQQLDDGMYALTTTLKGNITSAFTQLEQLAARG